MKLTKTRVESLDVPATGQALYWDEELPGYGVRVTSTGVRSYIVQGRANGKERRITIGQHGKPISETETLTADKARKLAMGLIASLSKGIDPVTEKNRTETLLVTLSEVSVIYCKERRTAKGGELTSRTKNDISRHINKSFSDWADKPVAAITRDMCSDRFSELSANAPTQANQAFRILRSLLNFAREAYRPGGVPILPENPVSVVSGKKMWNPNKAKNGRIPLNRVGLVWNMLQEKRLSPATQGSSKTGADIVTFLLLTGCRWSEAAELTWDRVNLKNGTWHLPDPKNHNEVTLPLSAPLRKMLESRPRKKGNPHVFPSRLSKDSHYINNAQPTMNQVSSIAELHITPHDLRRTFISIGIELKHEMWRLKLLTNHVIQDDVTIINYTETSDLRYLSGEAEHIASWIEQQGLAAKTTSMASHQSD
ncbi:MAG: integrase family protein [Methylotenera sp.]|nr:integrase family protein [Methylotenera sp.]MDD4926820.1 integrase family protein [Methylotenera sp.]